MKSNRVKVSFGGVFWPSLVASVIVLVLIFVFIFAIIGGLIGSKPIYSIGDKAVLHMKLNGPINETSDTDFDPMTFNIKSTLGLSEILYGLESAAADDKVKGLFLEIGSPQCGYATAMEIRRAIQQFEESGKFVVSYFQGEAIGMKQYFIGSAAGDAFGFPTSMFEFMGLGAELMFYKGMFDKLDLEMQVIRGSDNHFKSAVEPYFLEKMSDSSRVQIERYLTSLWEDIKEEIHLTRGVDIAELDRIADSAYIRRVNDAVKYGLLDEALYRDEVIERIKEKVNLDDSDKLNLKGFQKYASKKFDLRNLLLSTGNNNIAVILAEGGVVKKGDGLSSDKITEYFKEARKDKNIKAVVFRVNSPGGSALASDEIWREVKLTREVKPVYVSMGDVAASGGYYIAAPATKIFAESTTITGSIGVFGVIPYTGAMLENKLGLSFDRVGTNKRSVLSTNKKLDDTELQILQEEVDFIYDQFLERVATGRGISKEEVHKYARGRVWTGKDAKKIGLVDELGGLKDVIYYAAAQDSIEKSEIKVQYFPKRSKEPWMEVLQALDQDNEDGSMNNSSLTKELMDLYRRLDNIENYIGIQARLPFDIKIN
jgi:protease-4